MLELTYSSLSSFRRCPRSYYWKYIRCIRWAEQSAAQSVGTAVHEALARMLVDESWDVPDSHDPELVEDILRRFCESGRAKTWRVLATEKEFATKLPTKTGNVNPHYELRGKLDLLLSHGHQNAAVVDHKTTIVNRDDMERRLTMDDQLALYAWAMLQEGYRVDAVGYHVLRRKIPSAPKVRQDGRLSAAGCDTTPEVYHNAMASTGSHGPPWEDVYQNLLRRDPWDYTIFAPISPDRIWNAAFGAARTGRQILLCQKDAYWTMNAPTACNRPYACNFRPLCSADAIPEDNMLWDMGFCLKERAHEELSEKQG